MRLIGTSGDLQVKEEKWIRVCQLLYNQTSSKLTVAPPKTMLSPEPPVALREAQFQVPVQWPQSTPTRVAPLLTVTDVVEPVKLMPLFEGKKR